MENAQKLVVLAHRSGDVRVINLQCQMVGKRVMGQDLKLENIKMMANKNQLPSGSL